MVNRRNKIRVGQKFLQFRDEMKKDIFDQTGRRVSDTELTDSISEFWKEEKLNKIALPRARRKRKGGLFL